MPLGRRGSERFSNLPRVTQLRAGRGETQTQAASARRYYPGLAWPGLGCCRPAEAQGEVGCPSGACPGYALGGSLRGLAPGLCLSELPAEPPPFPRPFSQMQCVLGR